MLVMRLVMRFLVFCYAISYILCQNLVVFGIKIAYKWYILTRFSYYFTLKTYCK